MRRDFAKWFKEIGSAHEDVPEVLADGLEAVKRVQSASWWEWDKGSSTFFWRWPQDYQEVARVRIAPMFIGDPPSERSHQPPYDDEEIWSKVKAKLENVMEKGYIEMVEINLVEALMFMFHVPKGNISKLS